MDSVSVADIEDNALKEPKRLDFTTILDCKTSSDLEYRFYLTPNEIVRFDSADTKTTVFKEKIISFDCTDKTIFAVTSQNKVLTASITPSGNDDGNAAPSLPASKLVACCAKDALLLTTNDKFYYIPDNEGASKYLENFPTGKPLTIAAGDHHMVAILVDSNDNANAPEDCPKRQTTLPSISSVLSDHQLSDFSARLLKFKRRGTPLPCSPLVDPSQDEVGNYDMQEMKTVIYKWENEERVVHLRIPHVIFASCGKEHTALTTAFGKLFLVGKPFYSMRPSFDNPQEVKCATAFVLKAVAGEYVTVVMLLSIDPNRQGHGPVVGVVNNDFTLRFCSLPNESVPLGVSCSRRCKTGTVILRVNFGGTQTANIFGFCEKYAEVVEDISRQEIDNYRGNPPSEPHSMLCQIIKQLIQSMITLMRHICFHLFLSPADGDGHRRLLLLLRNHIFDVEKLWHQLHLVYTHKHLRETLEGSINLVNLKKKAPSMDLLMKLLIELQDILKDEVLKEIQKEALEVSKCVSESEAQSLKWKDVIKHKELLQFLCLLGEKLNLSTFENNHHDDLAAPLKIEITFKKFDGLENFFPMQANMAEKAGRNPPKSLCLTEKHLILSWHGFIIAWKLSAVWISSVTPKFVITTPEMDLTLSVRKHNDSVKKWLEHLVEAISKTFVTTIGVSQNIGSLDKFSVRKMRYQFQIGFMKGFDYDGEWKNGRFEGHGHLVANGITKREGTKTVYVTLKCEYEGEFRDGILNGFGTFAKFSGYQDSDETDPHDEIYAGHWKDGRLNGFITALDVKYERSELTRTGIKQPSHFDLFYGQRCNETLVGRGFRFGKERSSIEDVCEPDTGIKHIIVIDHKKKLVDYTLTSDIQCRGEICDDNTGYWYKGVLNKGNEPAGKGILVWNYSTDYPVIVEGKVSMRPDGLWVNGRISNAVADIRKRRESEPPNPRRDVDRWQLLKDDCNFALVAGHPEQADEDAMATFVWEKKLKPLLKEPTFIRCDANGTTRPLASDAEIEEWQSALTSRNISSATWEAMKAVTCRLLKNITFPLSVLIAVRENAIEFPVGFAAMKGAKIYHLVKEDMDQLLADMYFLIRIFFPILPKEPNEKIDLGGQNYVYGRDFCSSVLPENLRTSFINILNQEAQTADKLYGSGRSNHSDVFILEESLEIESMNLLNALKAETNQLPGGGSESDPLTDRSCFTRTFGSFVNELRDIVQAERTTESIFFKEPVMNFQLLQRLETVLTNFDQFLEHINQEPEGLKESDKKKARIYLFWKAKLPAMNFTVEFLKFFMKHRISSAQLTLLDGIQEDNWESLSIGSR